MQIKPDKNTKILFVLILVIIIISIGATFNRALITRDFEVFYDDYGEGGGEEFEEIEETKV